MSDVKNFRPEKRFVVNDYATWLKASPFFLVTNYQGLAVTHFNELRKRLRAVGASLHVVKNSIFKIAAQEIGIAELGSVLAGQQAVVFGRQDVAVAAKVLKTFIAEFDKPKLQFGFVGDKRLEKEEIVILADLPPLEVLRGRIMGVISAPATRLVQVLNAPASQLVRTLQAKVDKGE